MLFVLMGSWIPEACARGLRFRFRVPAVTLNRRGVDSGQQTLANAVFGLGVEVWGPARGAHSLFGVFGEEGSNWYLGSRFARIRAPFWESPSQGLSYI